MNWSATEILLLLTNLGTLIRWWFDRRDAQSTLKTGKDKADEAVATLTKALETKNEEMDEDKADWQEERSQYQARIAHLESLVFGPEWLTMMSILKRLLWPLRPRNHREFQRFLERMERATAYGQEQQAQSQSRRSSRDLSETMNVPPLWRRQEGERP